MPEARETTITAWMILRRRVAMGEVLQAIAVVVVLTVVVAAGVAAG